MPNPIGRALRNHRAGDHTLVWADVNMQAADIFALTSPAFEHGNPIPERYRGHIFGSNLSPALVWSKPPAGTQELVLIVQDSDAPGKRPATHALTAGLDPVQLGVAENDLTNPSPISGLRHGKGPLGHLGWVGPAPIPSHGPHFYVFQLFALDRPTQLREKFTLSEALSAMTGHVIGRARLDGTYEIP